MSSDLKAGREPEVGDAEVVTLRKQIVELNRRIENQSEVYRSLLAYICGFGPRPRFLPNRDEDIRATFKHLGWPLPVATTGTCECGHSRDDHFASGVGGCAIWTTTRDGASLPCQCFEFRHPPTQPTQENGT